MTRGRFVAGVVLPTLAVASLWFGPLISGARTLYLRDVFATHLPLKTAQVEAWKQGEIPLVDPYRAGGQPGLGNPNSVPLYPTNLLFLVAPVLWALNAHFWIHWLLAGAAMFWLARAWGLERNGAWAAALAYACSGYFVSQLNLYNAVAAAALGPAFVAASLDGARLGWPARRVAGAAGLAALLFLGGEPFLAGMAFAAAFAAVAFDDRRGGVAIRPWRIAAVCALALAAASPQWIESWRVLADAWRWQTRPLPGEVAFGSFEWPQVVEWFVPFAFGRPDRFDAEGFWGHAYHQMRPPLLFALAPGFACWIAVIASGMPRSRSARWAWTLIVLGGLLAWRPVAESLPRWFGDSLGFRYPSRFWWCVAVGASVLVGSGFERWWKAEKSARGTARVAAGALLLAVGVVYLWSRLGTNRPEFQRLASSIALAGLALCGLVLAAVLSKRRVALSLALLSVVHVGSQLALLSPALATDSTAFYEESIPEVLAAVPKDGAVAHGAFGRLGPWNVMDAVFPDGSGSWLQRRGFVELYPAWGPWFGRRFELNPTPEGFDSALSRRAQIWLASERDANRLRLLGAWGVRRVLLSRPLAETDGEAVPGREIGRLSAFGRDLWIYEPVGVSPPARLARTTRYVANFGQAVEQLVSPGFDPVLDLVVEGSGQPTGARTGTILRSEETRERLEFDVETPDATYLALTRAWLPIYRASVDGRDVPVSVASLDRIAVRVPAGRHEVVVETDRRPTRAALASMLLALVVSLGMAIRPS